MQARRRWPLLALPLLVAAAGAATFGVCLGFGFVNYDDPLYLLDNPLVTSPLGSGLATLLRTPALGYPSTTTVLTFALEHAVAGFNPTLHHATNLGLHIAASLLLFALARRLGLSAGAGLVACLLLAVHPLVTAAVCWLPGRKDLLVTVGVLGALHLWAGARADAVPSSGRRLGVLALCLAAMLAKPNAVVLPLVLAGVEWLRRGSGGLRRALPFLAGLLVLAAALLVLAACGQSELGVLGRRPSAGVLESAAAILVAQAQHLLVPVGLLPLYFKRGLEQVVPAASLALPLAAALVVALAGGAAVLWRRRQLVALLGLGLAVLGYLPTSQLVPTTRVLHDTYLYLPLAGVGLLVAALLDQLRGRTHSCAIAGAVACTMFLALGAHARAGCWKSSPALWAPVVEAYPDHPWAWRGLGDGYLFDDQPAAALGVYDEIGRRFPGFRVTDLNRGEAQLRVGDRRGAEATWAAGARAGDLAAAQRYARMLVDQRLLPLPSFRQDARQAVRQAEPWLLGQARPPQWFARAAALAAELGEPALAARLRQQTMAIAVRPGSSRK